MIRKISGICLVLFVFSGCISAMIRNQVKKTKVGGRIFLHENPKVGDYAIFDSFSESTFDMKMEGSALANSIVQSMIPKKIITTGTARYEILSVKENSLIIRLINEYISSSQSDSTKQVLDYEVDKTGLQLRTTIVEGPFISEPITVESVKPGEPGFIETTSDKNEKKVKIKTPAGEFLSQPVYAIQNIDITIDNAAGKGRGNTGTKSIVFLNPKVKFQMVYNQGIVSGTVSSELSAQMKLFLKVLRSVPEFFVNPAAGTKSILEMGLKEFVKQRISDEAKGKLNEIIGDIDKISASGGLTGNGYFILREHGNNRL